MKKIAILGPIHNDGWKFLQKLQYDVIEITDITKENLIKELSDVDGIILRTATLSADVMSKCLNLKIVARHGVGYDNVDIKFLKKKSISLLVTGTTTSVSPAEHIMFMILNISKSFDLFDQSVRNGKFDTIMHMKHNSFELLNKKILIVGFGAMGCRHAQSFLDKIFIPKKLALFLKCSNTL